MRPAHRPRPARLSTLPAASFPLLLALSALLACQAPSAPSAADASGAKPQAAAPADAASSPQAAAATTPPATTPPKEPPPPSQPITPPANPPTAADPNPTPAAADPATAPAAPTAPADIYGLSFVPADTPYVFAMLRPLPYEQWPWQLETFAPMFDELRRQLKQNPDLMSPDEARVFQAYLKAFDGKLSKEGLESLGFSLDARVVVYGLGIFPVVRLELKDGPKVMALIEQIERDAGQTMTRAQANGHPYMTFDLPQPAQAKGDDATLSISLAIQDNALIITAAPPGARAALMAAALSPDPAPNPLSADVLTALAQKHLTSPRAPLFAGAVRTHETIQALSGGGSALSQSLMTAAGLHPPPLSSPTCAAAFNRLAAWMPQLVLVGDAAKDSQEATFVLEINDTALLSEVALWRQPTPGLGMPQKSPTEPPPMLAIAVGLDLPRMFATLKSRAAYVAQQPLNCDLLQDLQAEASTLAADLDPASLPPEVASVKGVHLRLHSVQVDRASSMPSNIEASFVMLTDKPSHFWSMFAAFDPAFSTPLPPDGAPKALTPPALAASFITALHAAMTPNLLGLSLGKGRDASLTALMKSPAAPDAPLLSFAYDYGRFMSFFSAFDPSFGTATTFFQGLRWFITMDIGSSAHGLYIRATLDSTKP